jgi:flagellar assembly factor FliW
MRRVRTLRFGDLDVPEEEIVVFPAGLVGMPQWREFVLLRTADSGPFEWMQSLEEPAIAFLVADPAPFFPDYRVPVRAADLAAIGLEDPAQGVVRVILTLAERAEETTANLKGPVVIHPKTRRAVQLVISETPYTTRERLFREVSPC